MTQQGLVQSEDLSLEQEQRLRIMEADVGLALNYVRAIAQFSVPPNVIKALEEEYELRRAEIADAMQDLREKR